MKATFRLIPGLFAVGLVALGALGGSAQAAEVTLTVHHFLSPKSPAQVSFMEPWAKQVEKDSNGRIEVKIFPSMSLGGKPPELYRQVRDGTADIVWTLIGYTPGVFPRSEVFELPGVHRGSARATNLAIQDNFAMIAEDYKDLHPILVHVHAGNAIHMRDKPVHTVADVKGLKLRTPSRTGAWMIEAWGAEPVGMPVPALPEALSKGVVDGALVPFEIVLPLKLQELTKYSIEGADGSRFGTSVFLFAMNKERYDSLPDDLKAVIDKNSGPALAEKIGKVWDNVEAPGEAAQIASGGEIIKLTAAQKATFDTLGEKVVAKWIEEANKNGIDGQALVNAAKAAVAKHSGN
jgi:TRAP-type C4-dicarboxylate transport system substrate-binding protein